VLAERRRNLALRGVVRRAASELREASDLSDVAASVGRAATGLGASGARLEVGGRRLGRVERGDDARLSRHALAGRGRDALTLAWPRATELDRDREIAVELLCRGVARAAIRLERRTPTPVPWLARAEPERAAVIARDGRAGR
jgi:hypothetical protein